ncbi:hypothetical protein LguiB_012957 [Lonicera macranthoides]
MKPSVLQGILSPRLQMFIEEIDVDKCAFAVLVIRSGFTRTLKISWHSNYCCDSNLIWQNLKEAEKLALQHGFYVNNAIKTFSFFSKQLPKCRWCIQGGLRYRSRWSQR